MFVSDEYNMSIPFAIHLDPAAGVFYLLSPEGYIDYERPFPAIFPNFTSPFACDQNRQAIIGYPDEMPELEVVPDRPADRDPRGAHVLAPRGLVAHYRDNASVMRAVQKNIVIDLLNDEDEYVDFAEEPVAIVSRKRDRELPVDESSESESRSDDSSSSSSDENDSSSGDDSGSSDESDSEPENLGEEDDEPVEILRVEERDNGEIYIEIYEPGDRWRFIRIYHDGHRVKHVFNRHNGVFYHWKDRKKQRPSYCRDPKRNGVQKRKRVGRT